MSTVTGIKRLPVSSANSLAVTCNASRPRAATTTSTPSLASSRAIALPIPRLPPVTIAVFPVRFRSMLLLLSNDRLNVLWVGLDGLDM